MLKSDSKHSSFRGKMASFIKREEERKREERKNEALALFREKPKEIIFPKPNPNMDKFFCFPKEAVTGLKKAGLSIYPLFCSRADFKSNNWFHVSKEEIKIWTGITDVTISKGLKELEKAGLLKIRKKANYYEYRVEFIREDQITDNKGKYFTFMTYIIDSGIWTRLSVRAKLLYIAMRVDAKYDNELYSFIKDLEYEDKCNRVGETNKQERFDLCSTPLSQLCQMVNIELTNRSKVLKELTDVGLIESYGSDYFVYLFPQIL